MGRYIIQQSDTPDYWICTDQENGLVCKFQQGNYNKNQQFTLLEDSTASAIDLARLAKDMADWLRKNHYEKVFIK